MAFLLYLSDLVICCGPEELVSIFVGEPEGPDTPASSILNEVIRSEAEGVHYYSYFLLVTRILLNLSLKFAAAGLTLGTPNNIVESYTLNPEAMNKHMRTLENTFVPSLVRLIYKDAQCSSWTLRTREIVILAFFFLESIASRNEEIAQSLELYQALSRHKKMIDIDSDSLIMIPESFPNIFKMLNASN